MFFNELLKIWIGKINKIIPKLKNETFCLHGKNKYWEIYLTVLDFWTGQIFPKILYTFYEEA